MVWFFNRNPGRLMTMKLRTKFILTIGCVLFAAFGVTFQQTARFQDQLVVQYAERQAHMLSRQIILTRKWVADHNGLFFFQAPGVTTNPFLDEPSILEANGRMLVKRNPAMVTRELSEYAMDSDFCSFRVTSLNPVNPKNAPDQFEKKALLRFEQEALSELSEVENSSQGRFLRYLTPLKVEESCLECHGKHGYEVGDIRGALSLSIPMAWADQAVRENNQKLFFIAFLSITLVGVIMYLLIDIFVVRRLALLSQAMDRYPEEEFGEEGLSGRSDEIGTLSRRFADLGRRLLQSLDELEKSRQQVFQAEKMASLGRLSAGIAHEVNNPLGGMRNCVKTLRATPDDQQLLDRYLELLDKGLQRVEHTMRQLLNFGRQEPLRLQTVEINQVVEECFELIRYRMKDIELKLDLRFFGSFKVDVEALRQVVVNIGLNAMQAMSNQGVLTVSTSARKSSILISISDTGQGIDEEDLHRIFDPFYTTKDIGEGTGLGLSVSYSLVKRMGGTIMVESVMGQGSCFTIELPFGEKN